MASRIYIVRTTHPNELETVKLVRANTQAQALAHVVKLTHTVQVASANDVASLMGSGEVRHISEAQS